MFCGGDMVVADLAVPWMGVQALRPRFARMTRRWPSGKTGLGLPGSVRDGGVEMMGSCFGAENGSVKTQLQFNFTKGNEVNCFGDFNGF
jgi:hypothetical protein